MSPPDTPLLPEHADTAADQRRMTNEFRLALAWTCAAFVALAAGLAPVSGSYVNGQYLPIGPDAFYHAKRILETVKDASNFFQFDPFMHAPEGSIISWPWLYDYSMALLTRAAIALNLSDDPMAVLVHLPALSFPVAVGLVLLICRALRLSVTATLLGLLATALFPLSQTLYGVGNIDHHFAEHLFVLGGLAAGASWLRRPDSRVLAAAAGVVLAIAPGIHASLFILQLPILMALGIAWLRGTQPPRTTLTFGIALLGGTLAVALPSLALQQGRFEFHTLSWFQVYVAACTGALSVLVAWLKRSGRNLAIVLGVASAMFVVTLGQLALAGDFFTVSVEGMDRISEVQSIWQMWHETRSFAYVVQLYTYLLCLLPLTGALCLWNVVRDHDLPRSLFWISCIFGLALLTMQLRLQYFGSFALYLPWLVFLDQRLADSTSHRRIKPAHLWAIAALSLAVAYGPGVRVNFTAKPAVAGEPNYAVTRPIYATFARACEQHPGVALANPDDGHYVRFHTTCSVIGNNFLVTEQDAQKVKFTRELMSLPAADVARAAPYVRYVYVRRDTMFFVTPDGQLEFAPGDYPTLPELPLVRELLNADVSRLPPGFHLIDELRVSGPNQIPYARLFAIHP